MSIRRLAREIRDRVVNRILIGTADILTFSYPSWLRAVKIALLRLTGMRIGSPVFIDHGFRCFFPGNITISGDVSMGHYNRIWAFHPVHIGPHVQTALGLTIVSGSHKVEDYAPLGDQKVVLEGENWIGANVTILGKVTIGRGSVIGAGAVVTGDIPPYSVAVGVPAKVVRKRDPAESVVHPFGAYRPAFFDGNLPA